MKTGNIEQMLKEFSDGTYDLTDNGKCKKNNRICLLNSEINGIKVLSFYGINNKHRSLWNCECHCGKKFVSVGTELKRGKIKSCGCMRNTINGLYKSRLYRIHHLMICRCYTESTSNYDRYGGRGITVCDNWKNDFMNFYRWAIGNGYREDLTLDRIDNDGNYCPENCRWVTKKEQSNNMSTNFIISYGGETMTLTQWAEKIGIDRRTLGKRFSNGWETERALTTPVNKNLSRRKSHK